MMVLFWTGAKIVVRSTEVEATTIFGGWGWLVEFLECIANSTSSSMWASFIEEMVSFERPSPYSLNNN